MNGEDGLLLISLDQKFAGYPSLAGLLVTQ